MIHQITEINFPSYATLSSATATLNDMGNKLITAQVKIDGSITPDFSFDWEIEFKGERYIQPLREPQASKGNAQRRKKDMGTREERYIIPQPLKAKQSWRVK